MKSVVLARTAAIAAVGILAGIGCNAGAEQSPTAAAGSGPGAPAVPTPRPVSAGVAPPAAETPSLEDRLAAMDAAMASIVPGEFAATEDMPEPAPELVTDSAPAPDLGGMAVSAVPAPGAVDDQGNLHGDGLASASIFVFDKNGTLAWKSVGEKYSTTVPSATLIEALEQIGA